MSWHDIAYWDPGAGFWATLVGGLVIASGSFSLLYFFRNQWRSTLEGRMFLGLMIGMTLVFSVIFASFYFQDYPFRWLVRAVVYSNLLAAYIFAHYLRHHAKKRSARAFQGAVSALFLQYGEELEGWTEERLAEEVRMYLKANPRTR